MSLFFGRWRFLTNGYDHFVVVAFAIFGVLVISLVTNGLLLVGVLLSALAFVLDDDGVIVFVFAS
jgi:hypothetical protein